MLCTLELFPYTSLERSVFWGEPKCLWWGRGFNWRPLPSLRVSRRLLASQSRVLSQISPYEICTGKSDTRTAFSQSNSAFPCLYHSTNSPYSSLSTLCFTRRTTWRSLEIFQNAMFFRKSKTIGEKTLSGFLGNKQTFEITTLSVSFRFIFRNTWRCLQNGYKCQVV